MRSCSGIGNKSVPLRHRLYRRDLGPLRGGSIYAGQPSQAGAELPLPSKPVEGVKRCKTPKDSAQPRAINAPGVILVTLAIFVCIHLYRLALSDESAIEFLLQFAFIPARYTAPLDLSGGGFPGGVAADVWTFASYSLLHGDWGHLIINGLFMLAFGSAVGAASFCHRLCHLQSAVCGGGCHFHDDVSMGRGDCRDRCISRSFGPVCGGHPVDLRASGRDFPVRWKCREPRTSAPILWFSAIQEP